MIPDFKLTPREAFDWALMMTVCGTYENRPGALIQRLAKHIREPLSKLKSSDIANDRVFDRRQS